MSNIKDKYNQLRKLAKLSSSVISEFGVRYFIIAAVAQFKKSGLSILQTEIEQPEPEYSEPHAYKTWLYKHSITDESELKIRQKLETFTQKPKIVVVISISKNDKNEITRTLDSLRNQIYDNFEICLSCRNSSTTSENEIKSQLSDSALTNKVRLEQRPMNEFLLAEDCDFLMFMNAGDSLTNDALFQIAEILNKIPDLDMIYSDEEQADESHNRIPFFKPSWSPDMFLGFDYISNYYGVRTKLFKQVGGFRNDLDSAQHYDLLLRITEKTGKIGHVPFILVKIGVPPEHSKERFDNHYKKAIADALVRRGIKGEVLGGNLPKTFRVKYSLGKQPKVSIIIPTKDQRDLLKRCLASIEKKTTYKNYEIIIVDNNSTQEETLSYFKSLPYKVIQYGEPFNFSRLNNIAATHATGEYLLFLNDDTAVIEPQWLAEMASIAQQERVGVVGPKLVLTSNAIQHAGMVMFKTGAAFHPFAGLQADSPGYFGFPNIIRNCSAVTGACLLVRKELFEMVGGFDEKFDLYYQDADLCLKIIESGYRIVYTPYAILLHEGSSTIKKSTPSFFAVENQQQFYKKWPNLKQGDPFYNPNLGWNYRIAS